MTTYTRIQVTEGESIIEPVTVDEAKDWLRVDYDDDDDVIEGMIKGARQSIEQFLNIALVDKSVVVDVKTTCEEDLIRLPYVDSAQGEIEVTDIDNDDSAVETDNYKIRGAQVKINYYGYFSIAYDIEAGEIPEAIKEAIKMEVAERYKNRGENDNTEGLSKGAINKASSFQQVWL